MEEMVAVFVCGFILAWSILPKNSKELLMVLDALKAEIASFIAKANSAATVITELKSQNAALAGQVATLTQQLNDASTEAADAAALVDQIKPAEAALDAVNPPPATAAS